MVPASRSQGKFFLLSRDCYSPQLCFLNIYDQGRTYEELDILFAKKIPARKFKAAEVQVYEDSEYNIFLDD